MADLDVTEILEDPDFASVFTVLRRTDVVSPKGRVTTTTKRTRNVLGVVVPSEPTQNSRADDSQMTARNIDIVTRFRLRPAASGVQPDQVQLDGDPTIYTVQSIKLWTRFGPGFIKATLGSQNASDATQP